MNLLIELIKQSKVATSFWKGDIYTKKTKNASDSLCLTSLTGQHSSLPGGELVSNSDINKTYIFLCFKESKNYKNVHLVLCTHLHVINSKNIMVNFDECFYVGMPELELYELNGNINNSLQGKWPAILNHLKEQKIKLEIHDVRSFSIKQATKRRNNKAASTKKRSK